ncbi:hypothetical protein [Sinorhizobium medicae]|uniref:hypothetical protein n=1 Tax=Sinorhizobium medicae TaxID=110321 RepID=UPI0018659614|nr:hypothetical protein [Sinorhizobium medicae]
MAITHLKRGNPDTLRIEENTQVRSVDEGILSDIEMRGDAAIRELSAKFDTYMPDVSPKRGRYRCPDEQGVAPRIKCHAEPIEIIRTAIS